MSWDNMPCRVAYDTDQFYAGKNEAEWQEDWKQCVKCEDDVDPGIGMDWPGGFMCSNCLCAWAKKYPGRKWGEYRLKVEAELIGAEKHAFLFGRRG